MSIPVAIVSCDKDFDDPDEKLLVRALEHAGVDPTVVAWDDPSARWDDFALSVVRSTWNYVERREEFLRWARATPRLCNSPAVLTYSTDKHYLGHLADRGVQVIATSFVDVGMKPTFPNSDFVIKPTIGAGANDAQKFVAGDLVRANEHVRQLHERGRDVMIQPYVSSIDVDGELALIYIDGAFSHAMSKAAMLNCPEADRDAQFRMAQMASTTAPPDAQSFAEGVLAASGYADLLYARVDVVRDESGWAVMELELVEPCLYLTYHPAAADQLAATIARRVDSRPPH